MVAQNPGAHEHSSDALHVAWSPQGAPTGPQANAGTQAVAPVAPFVVVPVGQGTHADVPTGCVAAAKKSAAHSAHALALTLGGFLPPPFLDVEAPLLVTIGTVPVVPTRAEPAGQKQRPASSTGAMGPSVVQARHVAGCGALLWPPPFPAVQRTQPAIWGHDLPLLPPAWAGVTVVCDGGVCCEWPKLVFCVSRRRVGVSARARR